MWVVVDPHIAGVVDEGVRHPHAPKSRGVGVMVGKMRDGNVRHAQIAIVDVGPNDRGRTPVIARAGANMQKMRHPGRRRTLDSLNIDEGGRVAVPRFNDVVLVTDE